MANRTTDQVHSDTGADDDVVVGDVGDAGIINRYKIPEQWSMPREVPHS